MQDKTIFLLIGPKGCGKSYIAQLMSKEFSIDYVDIEDFAKHVHKDQHIDDDCYLKEVFKKIETGIRNLLNEKDRIIFESIGLSENFDTLFENLDRDFKVVTIGVYADNDTCMKRIQDRDPSVQLDLTQEQLEEINQLIKEKNIETRFRIDNEDKTMYQLMNELSDIVEEN